MSNLTPEAGGSAMSGQFNALEMLARLASAPAPIRERQFTIRLEGLGMVTTDPAGNELLYDELLGDVE